MLTVIPRLSTEWIVSLTLRMTTLATSSRFCSVIQLTQGGVFQQHCDRTPAVILYPPRDRFYIASSINDNPDHCIASAKGLTVNVYTNIEIHQRYVSGGRYRYFIKINGEEIASIINTKARQFYDVKVYASFENDPCPGYIKRFYVTNFLQILYIVITQGVHNDRVDSLYSKTHSPPYCCALLLDEGISIMLFCCTERVNQ